MTTDGPVPESDFDRSQRKRREDQEYHAWQRRLAKDLPDLARRVFALRDRLYMGCGVHYGLEKSLGQVITIANDYEILGSFPDRPANEAIVADFHKRLREAEASADRLDPPILIGP